MSSPFEDMWHRRRGGADIMVVAVSLGLAVLSGCAGQPNDGRVDVSGRISYDGQPVRLGRVLFSTASGKGDASGELDAEGGFRVRMFPGEYVVVVRSTDGFEHLDEKGNLVLPTKLVPAKYFDAKTSDLTLTVAAGMKAASIVLDAQRD